MPEDIHPIYSILEVAANPLTPEENVLFAKRWKAYDARAEVTKNLSEIIK